MVVYNCKLNVCFDPQYSDYEKVVIEDRVAKEQARRKAEQELEELKAATKVGSKKGFAIPCLPCSKSFKAH